MLAHLVGSFVYCVQPEVDRVTPFAEELVERLMPPANVVRIASREVDRMMERQRQEIGLRTQIHLPWDE